VKVTKVLSLTKAKNDDVVLRLAADETLLDALPGQYVNLAACEQAQQITSAFLFVANVSLAYVEVYLPSEDAVKSQIDTNVTEVLVSEPQGTAFVLPTFFSHIGNEHHVIKPVLLADDIGLPAIIFLAEKIKIICGLQPLVFLFSQTQFPFTPVPSQFIVSNIPVGVLAACPMLEDKKIPSRLLSETVVPGCYEGAMDAFLAGLPNTFFRDINIEVYAAGGKSLLDAADVFAQRHHLAIQKLQ